MKRKDREFKSCFISAPFGANLGTLTRVLDRLDIHWEWAKSHLAYSDRLPGDLRKIIRGVDFVIGVLFGGLANANTMFEIGVAAGAGKPVLLILADDNQVPSNLTGFPNVRASLTDDTAIELHLDLLMRTARHAFRYQVSGQQRAISPTPSPGLGLGKSVVHDLGPANALEAEVVRLIEEAGGRVLLHPRPEDSPDKFAPDALFWLPSRDAELLNPAVVEIKSAPMTAHQLDETEQRMLGFLQHTGVRTGLIVARIIHPRALADFRSSPLLNVFVLEFERFRELLKSDELVDHLRQERNRAAHGLR